MTEVERIKKIIKEDKSFRNNFLGVKNVKTAVAIARSKGFGITKDDILSDNELSDYLLEASAGGGWSWVDYICSAIVPGYGIVKAISEANKEDKPNVTNNYNITNNDQSIHITGDNNKAQQVIQQGKKE